MTQGPEIWTIGHWTCPIPTFVAPLDTVHIDMVADVRAHPGSRRNPQFGSTEMAQWLPEHGIDYRHLTALTGRRRRQADIDPNINAGWQNASFKNYADYTLTDEFRDGLEELTELGSSRRIAIMCGEPMPWRCHRLLIANTLTAQGWTVRHLMASGPTREHVLGQWGATPTLHDEQVTYPAQPSAGPPIPRS